MPLEREPVRPGPPRRGESQRKHGEPQRPPPAARATRRWRPRQMPRLPTQTPKPLRQMPNTPTPPKPGPPQQTPGEQLRRRGEPPRSPPAARATRRWRPRQMPRLPTQTPKPLRQMLNAPTPSKPGPPQQTPGEQLRRRGEPPPLRHAMPETKQTRIGRKPPPLPPKPRPLRQMLNAPTPQKPGQPQHAPGEQLRRRGEPPQMRHEPPETKQRSANGFAILMPRRLWRKHKCLFLSRASLTISTNQQLPPTLSRPRAWPRTHTHGAPNSPTRPKPGETPQHTGEPLQPPPTTPTTQHSPPTPRHWARMPMNRPGFGGGSVYWFPTGVGSVWWAA